MMYAKNRWRQKDLTLSIYLNVDFESRNRAVLQVQGPKSLDLIRSTTNGQLADTLRYFLAHKTIATRNNPGRVCGRQ